MAITKQITCDVCGGTKTATNGWSLARLFPNGTVIFKKWNDKAAWRPGISHLCTSACESKFLTRITSPWRETKNVQTSVLVESSEGYPPAEIPELPQS